MEYEYRRPLRVLSKTRTGGRNQRCGKDPAASEVLPIHPVFVDNRAVSDRLVTTLKDASLHGWPAGRRDCANAIEDADETK